MTKLIAACGGTGPASTAPSFYSCIAAYRVQCPREIRLQCEAWARYIEGLDEKKPVFGYDLTGKFRWMNAPNNYHEFTITPEMLNKS